MPAAATFAYNDQQIADLRRVLTPGQVKQAAFQAVSRTTAKAKAICVEAVLSQTTVARKYVTGTNRRAAITSKVSRGDIPEGRVTIRDIKLPASTFKFQNAKPNGVYITMDKARSPTQFRHAFVSTVASAAQAEMGISHRGVYTRARMPGKPKTTPKGFAWRKPLREVMGPSVASQISVEKTQKVVLEKIGDELTKQLDSQVSRFTDGKYKTLGDATAGFDAITANV